MASNSSQPSPLKIGIVGLGPFAQFLAATFVKQGHALTAVSRTDHSLIASRLGILSFNSYDQFIDAHNDVILICTSILSLSEVLKSIPFDRIKGPTLFVDVLSVKEHPQKLLLQAIPVDSDLLCTHPMFGPESGKDGWRGLPIVYDKVRIRNEDLCSRFLGIFQNEGCRMVEMTCEEHDREAARSQFLTHTVGRILSEMEIESTSMDTKGFQTLIQLKDNTVKDSFDLYSGLYVHNRFAKQELKALELALEAVKQKLQEKMDNTLEENS
ncbi:hypothetical protein Scep_015614 [Stephania cephalantha]|uniref:Prephenate/arogenate dehydrogenase domain-containing protein n=1 Tax=Stephania cephalantha TaxID=152367 RepID=A0AAP0J5G3_9MAGN